MLHVIICFLIDIISVSFDHGDKQFLCHVYVHGYHILTTDLGILKLGNFGSLPLDLLLEYCIEDIAFGLFTANWYSQLGYTAIFGELLLNVCYVGF